MSEGNIDIDTSLQCSLQVLKASGLSSGSFNSAIAMGPKSICSNIQDDMANITLSFVFDFFAWESYCQI